MCFAAPGKAWTDYVLATHKYSYSWLDPRTNRDARCRCASGCGLACGRRDLHDVPGCKRVCGGRASWHRRLSHHRLRVALVPRGWSSPQRGCQVGVGALLDGAKLAMQAPVHRPGRLSVSAAWYPLRCAFLCSRCAWPWALRTLARCAGCLGVRPCTDSLLAFACTVAGRGTYGETPPDGGKSPAASNDASPADTL